MPWCLQELKGGVLPLVENVAGYARLVILLIDEEEGSWVIGRSHPLVDH